VQLAQETRPSSPFIWSIMKNTDNFTNVSHHWNRRLTENR
jgi:hypothetical protein